MKKRWILLIFLGAMLVLTACCDGMSKADIFALVTGHEATLREDIARDDFTRSSSLRGVRSIFHRDREEIEFACGGAGMGGNTRYCGFYYAPSDAPSGLDFISASALVPEGSGWRYLEEGGDNTYYTERICEGFYYYEAAY